MEKNEVIAQLVQMFQGMDWFFEVGTDDLGRITVYANYMNVEVMRLVPNRVDRYDVCLHFAASKIASRDNFVGKKGGVSLPAYQSLDVVGESIEAPAVEEENKSLLYLQSQLDKLEKACGPNILADIFFETHDKKFAVTNMSIKHPKIREVMDKLYDNFGFDIIYEELEL